jgi:hypothetical protein
MKNSRQEYEEYLEDMRDLEESYCEPRENAAIMWLGFFIGIFQPLWIYFNLN